MHGETILTCAGVDIGMPKWILIENTGATVVTASEADALKGNGIDYIAYFLLSDHEKNIADHAFSMEA